LLNCLDNFVLTGPQALAEPDRTSEILIEASRISIDPDGEESQQTVNPTDSQDFTSQNSSLSTAAFPVCRFL
jgi:hypothetical protein